MNGRKINGLSFLLLPQPCFSGRGPLTDFLQGPLIGVACLVEGSLNDGVAAEAVVALFEQLPHS